MMRLRRASVIAALILLTSAATSYAECAWVLWFNPEANIHVVESAHASVMECDVALVDLGSSAHATVTRYTAVHPPATTSCSEKRAWNTSHIAVSTTPWTRVG